MPASRPQTPASVKRELRQEAGFGCCACDLPIYQYHHIVPWETEHHFHTTDMMILCPNHHDQASKGAMPEDEQRRYKAAPYNIGRGYAEGVLRVGQRYCAVEAGGGVLLVGDGAWIEVDGEAILTLGLGERGILLLTLMLYDESDNLAAHVEDNEWLAGDASTWDMESDWQRLTLRSAPRQIVLRIDARGEPMRLRGELWRRGKQITMSGRGLEMTEGIQISGLGLVRMGIKLETGAGHATWVPKDETGGMIVSEPDPIKRLVKSVEAFNKLEAGE